MTTAFTRDPLAGRLPVTIVTGFLGSGKTTLIRHLLADPGMARAAVIVNEFGEVGIDHELVAASSERTTLLANGCLCCVVRTDLQETLRELFVQRRAGQVIDFDRVFIETSGLADPAPVMQCLATDSMLAAHFCLDGVVTLVDAVNGSTQLEREREAVKQVAVADRLLLTKTDLADVSTIDSLCACARVVNPHAPMAIVVNGAIDPAQLRDIGLTNAHGDADRIRGWLGGLDKDGDDATRPAYLGERIASAARHDSSIRSFALTFDAPFAWPMFSAALELLTQLRGPDLLRVKGLVNVVGEAGPVVVQGVQHIFHPPVTLAQWPSADRRTRLVFITRNIERAAITALFSAVGALAAHPPADAR
jgi:G3E family GTPase